METRTTPPAGTVTVSGLWKYNLDGSRINYSVEETREGDGKGDGRLDADDGIAAGVLPEGDYFQISYDNSSTPNVGTEVGKLYDGGSLYLTLTGVKDYQASKVWETRRIRITARQVNSSCGVTEPGRATQRPRRPG